MAITDKLKNKLFEILKIKIDKADSFDISRELSYEANCAKNETWYNGNAYELSQLFKQTSNNNNSFWGAKETTGLEIRKIHTGLPKLLVNSLTNITLSDMNDIKFNNESNKELWEEIAKENDFKKLLTKATKNVLKLGDGAFKISFSQEISPLPIIEFYKGDRVAYTYNRGRIKEIKFYNYYNYKDNKYTLEETYGYGYVNYHLYKGENEVYLNSLPYTEGLENIVFDKNIILATSFMIWESDMYEGRGQSIYDGKSDIFDAIDEVTSQWQDAIRAGRVKTYIPESLIPRDFNNGFLLKPNAFDNQFIKVGTDMTENAKNEIKTEQPTIQVDAYEKTYITYLDLALQGLISPSTLGIDVKKLDNAESQREKEKATLYSRQSILDALNKTLYKVIQMTFDAYNLQYNKAIEEVEFELDFGEYANPSFEAVIETMSNPNTPMSLEAKVEEIWGDTKSEEWKAEEVKRIKEQSGIITLDEPSFSQDYALED